jgi:Fur family zinc uptake transcriptional regulator
LTPRFGPEIAAQLDRADAICERRGARLTQLRRDVLGLVLENTKPTGAYDLLDELRKHHKGSAPPTVYRALDFLLEHGLVHKIERLSAFVGCVHSFGEEKETHPHDDCRHAVQFLICIRCGLVVELNSEDIGQALSRAAEAGGFTIQTSTVEIEGLCSACAQAKQDDKTRQASHA